jgi:TRAP-type mannitol/chloroaromatic compound transport system permease small subunit
MPAPPERQPAARLMAAIDRLNRWAGRLAGWALVLMLILGCWNVFGRYAGLLLGRNLSSNGLIEAQWYLFACAFLLGLGWTLQRQGHVRVDVLQSRWPERRRIAVELAGTLGLLLPFVALVLIVSAAPTIESWRIAEASPDPGGLPRFWVKALIPLGFLLLGLQGIAEAIRLRLQGRELRQRR